MAVDKFYQHNISQSAISAEEKRRKLDRANMWDEDRQSRNWLEEARRPMRLALQHIRMMFLHAGINLDVDDPILYTAAMMYLEGDHKVSLSDDLEQLVKIVVELRCNIPLEGEEETHAAETPEERQVRIARMTAYFCDDPRKVD